MHYCEVEGLSLASVLPRRQTSARAHDESVTIQAAFPFQSAWLFDGVHSDGGSIRFGAVAVATV